MTAIPRTVMMDFPSAMKEVAEGKKVTKLEWKNTNIFLLLTDGFLKIHKEDGTTTPLLVSDGDMMGQDWIVVPPIGN